MEAPPRAVGAGAQVSRRAQCSRQIFIGVERRGSQENKPEVTTAQAGTEPLSLDPSSQQHPACFPPARLVCCHCTSPRTQVQVEATQDRAAKSRAATPCPGLGSPPRPQTGRDWDISTPTRVTKAALSPDQLCHTAPWQCQPTPCRGEAWMSTLEGCSVHHHHPQNPEEVQLFHGCDSKLQAVGLHSSEEGAQTVLWSPVQGSRETDESCFCRHSKAA